MAIDFRHLWRTWRRPLTIGILLGVFGYSFSSCYMTYVSGIGIFNAIQNHDYVAVRRILSEGTPPDELRIHGFPPLVFAVQEEDPYLVRLLLLYGSDPMRPLYGADNPECARLLINALHKSRYSSAEKEAGLNWALHNAARNWNAPVCRLLIQAGADPNSRHTESGEMPLMAWAQPSITSDQAEHDAKETLNLLLKSGARPELRNQQGQTAFEIAKALGNSKMAQMLKTARQNNPTKSR